MFYFFKFSDFELSSTRIVFILIFGYLALQQSIDLIKEFNDLKEYSILGFSNNLFYFDPKFQFQYLF